mgnify:CR=1 FL=1
MIRMYEPPVTKRQKTPNIFVPPAARHLPEPTLREFDQVRDELSARLAAAEGLDWGRFRVISPVSLLVRVRFVGYVGFLLAHDRRHLWTARQILAAPGYPRCWARLRRPAAFFYWRGVGVECLVG